MDPLEYKNGIKIYVVPEYSKQPNLNTQLLDNAVAATTVRANLNNISLIKIWLQHSMSIWRLRKEWPQPAESTVTAASQ